MRCLARSFFPRKLLLDLAWADVLLPFGRGAPGDDTPQPAWGLRQGAQGQQMIETTFPPFDLSFGVQGQSQDQAQARHQTQAQPVLPFSVEKKKQEARGGVATFLVGLGLVTTIHG